LKSILYIPIEVKVRELLSRTSIALSALNEGFDEVVVGRDFDVFNGIKEPGTILLKSAATFESKLVSKLVAEGHSVFSLDEEGIIPPLNDPSINSRFSKELIGDLSGIFLNGRLELSTIPMNKSHSEKLFLTGNPRFDFYSKSARVIYHDSINEISKSVGGKKVILVVSRFGDVNLSSGVDFFKLLADCGYIHSKETREYFEGFYNHSKNLFQRFLELPEKLAKEYPNHVVVVRPHPSECHEVWQKSVRSKNILVTSEHDIAPWLMRSSVMIHNGCTTSVESIAIGTPVVSYMPYSSGEYDLNMANELGRIVVNEDQLLTVLNDVVRDGVFPNRNEKKFSYIIEYSEGQRSSKKIAKYLYDGRTRFKSELRFSVKPSRKALLYGKEVVTLMCYKLGLRNSYGRKKFPSLRRKEFENIVDLVSSAFAENTKYSLNRVGFDAFRIKKDR